MNPLIKKLLTLISIVFIYGVSSLAYSQNKMENTLSDIQFVINNEDFTLQEVYFDGFANAIRICVFESESALWTIKYCSYGEEMVEGPWYKVMAGSFSIKNTNVELQYYIEQDDHVYRRIMDGFFDYDAEYAVFSRVNLVEDAQIGVNWFEDSEFPFPFLQTLAYEQEQYIMQSDESLKTIDS